MKANIYRKMISSCENFGKRKKRIEIRRMHTDREMERLLEVGS